MASLSEQSLTTPKQSLTIPKKKKKKGTNVTFSINKGEYLYKDLIMKWGIGTLTQVPAVGHFGTFLVCIRIYYLFKIVQ